MIVLVLAFVTRSNFNPVVKRLWVLTSQRAHVCGSSSFSIFGISFGIEDEYSHAQGLGPQSPAFTGVANLESFTGVINCFIFSSVFTRPSILNF